MTSFKEEEAQDQAKMESAMGSLHITEQDREEGDKMRKQEIIKTEIKVRKSKETITTTAFFWPFSCCL